MTRRRTKGCPCSARPSGTIAAVVNALAKAWIELGENGSIFLRPRGKPRFGGAPTEADAPCYLAQGYAAICCGEPGLAAIRRMPECSELGRA